MLITKFCHKTLHQSLADFNQARVNSLLTASNALIRSNELSLTAIGRCLEGLTSVKHKIKRIDRLLGNQKLHSERDSIYRALFKGLFAKLPCYVVAVDWSGCCNREHWLLRASLLVDGRAIPIYNTVVTQDNQEKEHIHNQFLDVLATMLPANKTVYIVTDGGFKTPWFKKIESLGWYYLGRVRGRIFGKVDGSSWCSVSELGKNANIKAKKLGDGLLGKTSKSQVSCSFVSYKGKAKNRHKIKQRNKGIYPDAERTYKSIAKEPWILVTNDSKLSPMKAVIYYSKRMQIEQNFRDDKSQRYGFSWHHSQTQNSERISILCLIACIATLVLWVIGFASERKGINQKYQANTTKSKRVLSFLTLTKNMILDTSKAQLIRLFSSGLAILSKNYLRIIDQPLF